LFIKELLAADVGNLEEYQSIDGKIAGLSVKCVCGLETGEIGFQLHVNSTSELSDLWRILMTERRDFEVIPVGLKALNSLRIEAGIPRFGNELDDSIIPLEAELEKAIDFEKGCYIGQEIIARMKYRGHTNRLLRGIEIDSEDLPNEKTAIYSGEKQIGYVTSAVKSPTLNKVIALGYVRTAFTKHGSEVKIKTENGWVNATVSSLPFY
jgi:folate-binding protein YgfZ